MILEKLVVVCSARTQSNASNACLINEFPTHLSFHRSLTTTTTFSTALSIPHKMPGTSTRRRRQFRILMSEHTGRKRSGSEAGMTTRGANKANKTGSDSSKPSSKVKPASKAAPASKGKSAKRGPKVRSLPAPRLCTSSVPSTHFSFHYSLPRVRARLNNPRRPPRPPLSNPARSRSTST